MKEKLKELKVAPYTDVLVWAGGQPQHQQQQEASASSAFVAVEQARENLPPPVAAPDTQSSFVGEEFQDWEVISLALDTRGQLRALQDYLAQVGNMQPSAVSLTYIFINIFDHTGPSHR